jgi:hypothetical protein
LTSIVSRAPNASGRRASTATGARTTSSPSPAATASAANQTTPYALRHIYATLRIAAHHPTLYIESSMGTGLVGKVYGGVIRRYEGKGPLNLEVREGRRSPYRVRRLEGKLSASFRVKAAAELQDALWRRWGDQIPVLADQEPKIPPALEARLLSPGRRELSTVLLAELLTAHPATSATRAPAKEDAPLLGAHEVRAPRDSAPRSR